MSVVDVATLRAGAEAATRGPWVCNEEPSRYMAMDGDVRTRGLAGDQADDVAATLMHCDAAFIAAFDPPTVLAMLAELDTLRATVARIEALRDEWRSLPVWGPDERGLMILDDMDHDSLMSDLDAALAPPTPDPTTQEGGVGVPCRVCGAEVGSPCVRYTDEFPDAAKGTTTPRPHRFGGR